MDPVLEVKNLSKKFADVIAVDDISFSITEGKIVGLLGPNGAGKTTTIYMVLGLLTPSSGSIQIFGQDIRKNLRRVLSKMNFSSVYVSLPSNLYVWENLCFFSYLYNVDNWRQRAEFLLAEFELSQLKDKKTGELSSGQLTRLNLVKALLNSPQFLCLDEPTASLDPISARLVRQKLRQIARQDKVTILYTSHNMYEVEEVCDEVIFLYQGKIRAQTTPANLIHTLKQKNMEEVFFKLSEEREDNGTDFR